MFARNAAGLRRWKSEGGWTSQLEAGGQEGGDRMSLQRSHRTRLKVGVLQGCGDQGWIKQVETRGSIGWRQILKVSVSQDWEILKIIRPGSHGWFQSRGCPGVGCESAHRAGLEEPDGSWEGKMVASEEGAHGGRCPGWGGVGGARA